MSMLGTTTYPTLALWQIALDGTVLAENLLGKNTGVNILAYDGLGLPGMRTADVPLPQAHGVRALGDYHEGRELTFELCIVGAGCSIAERAANAWTQLRTLSGVWQARTADVTLELCMTDGTTYVSVGRPRRFQADTAGLRRGIVTVAAQFLATDPRMYAIGMDSVTLTYQVPASTGAGGLCLTDTPNSGGAAQVICLTDTPNGAGAAQVLCATSRLTGGGFVTNFGNTDTHPITTFPGPATNPTIQNLTTGRSLGFVVPLNPGTTLVVDHHARTIMLDGVARQDLLGPNADFWPLIPKDNALVFTQSGATDAQAFLRWRRAWL